MNASARPAVQITALSSSPTAWESMVAVRPDGKGDHHWHARRMVGIAKAVAKKSSPLIVDGSVLHEQRRRCGVVPRARKRRDVHVAKTGGRGIRRIAHLCRRSKDLYVRNRRRYFDDPARRASSNSWPKRNWVTASWHLACRCRQRDDSSKQESSLYLHSRHGRQAAVIRPSAARPITAAASRASDRWYHPDPTARIDKCSRRVSCRSGSRLHRFDLHQKRGQECCPGRLARCGSPLPDCRIDATMPTREPVT